MTKHHHHHSKGQAPQPQSSEAEASNGILFELPPLRGINDLNGVFKAPSQPILRDRLLGNLHHYQTNYFAFLFVVALANGIFYPVETFFCFAIPILTFILAKIVQIKVEQAKALKDQHPTLINVFLGLFSSFLATKLGHGIQLATALAVPIALIKLHAFLRMRSTKFERPKNDSPMTFLLRALGYME